MTDFHLICVGKVKDKNLTAIEEDYLKRLNLFKLKIHEVKSHDDNKKLEGDLVLKKIEEATKGKSAQIVTLEEKGKEFNSIDFSKFIEELMPSNQAVIFLIAGAAGHGEEVLKRKSNSLSLGKLTFPHKIARMLFAEQMYRAQTIIQGHPYHK